MITLSTPPVINSVLGGSAPVSYDKCVIGPFTFDPATLLVTGAVRLTSTANPEMNAVAGTLTINTQTARLDIAVPQLDFARRVALSGPQNSAAQQIVRDAQNALESGLISLGVLAGTQQTGA